MKSEHGFEIGSLEVRMTGEAAGMSERELQVCLGHLSCGHSVFKHPLFSEGENTLAAIIVALELHGIAPQNHKPPAEAVQEALVTPFVYTEEQFRELLLTDSWGDWLDRFHLIDGELVEYVKQKLEWAPPVDEYGETEDFEKAFLTFVEENFSKDEEFTSMLLESMETESCCGRSFWTWDHRRLEDLWWELCQETEVYEWWTVGYILAKELKELGEVVIDGLWGRTGSGQGVLQDGVFQQIARKRINK